MRTITTWPGAVSRDEQYRKEVAAEMRQFLQEREGRKTSYDEDLELERRLRWIMKRIGYALQKSRIRDARSYDYQTYRVMDPERNLVIARGETDYGLTLDDVCLWLSK